jgi:ligand-binding SRPBCC domain-containing protein
MAEYILERKQTIELPLEEVFTFFSDAENLEKITPRELNFHILTPLPIEIGLGTLIEYRLSLWCIPIYWKTKITKWNPPYEFEDTQLSGPYKQWIHLHRFTKLNDQVTLMEDCVRYRLPLEPLGDLALPLIKLQLDRIFDYREKSILDHLLASRQTAPA